jgi:Ca2+-binding EF-hand superfamily protein
MPLLSISAAARAVKKNRGTIHNYLKNGRLSSVMDGDGHAKIDTAELLRVFGELSTDGSVDAGVEKAFISTGNQQSGDMLVEVLKEQLNAALEREKKLIDMLEQEQQARREIEQRILALPDGQTKRPGLFSRLFGKP